MKKSKPEFVENEKLMLQLYVSGMTQRSMEAIENIKQLCKMHLDDGSYELEIIDIYKNPEVASEQQIVFSPSLIKKLPLPRKVLIGTFSNKDKVMKALGIGLKQE